MAVWAASHKIHRSHAGPCLEVSPAQDLHAFYESSSAWELVVGTRAAGTLPFTLRRHSAVHTMDRAPTPGTRLPSVSGVGFAPGTVLG